MSEVTIQINSLSAIQRLFGEDPEVKLAVRDSVIKRFMNHEVRNEPFIEAIKTACMAKAGEVITREIGTIEKDQWSTGPGKIKLAGRVATTIEDSVRTQIIDLVRNCANEYIDNIKPEINKRVEERMKYYFEDFVNNEIKRRIDEVRRSIK